MNNNLIKKVKVAGKKLAEVKNNLRSFEYSNKKISFNMKGKVLIGVIKTRISNESKVQVFVGANKVGETFIVPTALSYLCKSPISFAVILDVEKLFNSEDNYICIKLNDNEIIYKNKKNVFQKDLIPNHNFLLSLLPSYSFFGGVKHEPLIVEVQQNIKSITIKNVAENPSILNLRSIKFFDEKGSCIPSESIKVLASSITNKNKMPSEILKSRGFHSKSEINPSLTFLFNSSRSVSRLEIINRSDKWGARSQTLKILARCSDDEEIVIYDPFDNQSILLFFKNVKKVLGLQCLYNILDKSERVTILECIVSGLIECDYDYRACSLALNFLSTWSSTHIKSEEELALEIKILAFYIFTYIRNNIKNPWGLNLIAFSKILSSSREIESLEEELNRLLMSRGVNQIKFTKHGISPTAILVDDKREILYTLDKMIETLTNCNLKPCLAYGTLLGSIREKTFISHDDDVDILIECPEYISSFEEALIFMQSLVKKFNNELFTAYMRDTAVLHLVLKETNVMVDVFPYWKSESKAYLYMEKMRIRTIDSAILNGRSIATIDDHTFPVPEKAEHFLQERYGEGWRVSNKYHEWPWSLN